MNEQKINGAKSAPQAIVGTDEKAQYEVFRNGDLPRETIKEWIGNDLKAILSFVSGVLRDPEIMEPLVDAYYARYKKLHAPKPPENVEKSPN